MQFMIEFSIPQPMPQEMIELVGAQRDKVDELIFEGEILSYTLSRNRERLWIVVETETEDDAFDIISELPLTKFMKVDIHPLMFHDSADFVFSFSAN
jgi:muconolactone delta-isomerase